MFIPVFYVPGLTLGPGESALPRQVILFPTGLPPARPYGAGARPDALAQGHDAASAANSAREEVRKALPLAPNEARAALNEMLRIGEEYSAGGLLKELAAHQQLLLMPARWTAKPGESADLALFSRTGEAPAGQDKVKMPDWGASAEKGTGGSFADIRRELENCQKVLLLAESLQQREQELASLEKQYTGLEESLQELLQEGQEEDFAPAGHDDPAGVSSDEDDAPGDGEHGRASSSLSWRAVVDAVLPFLPENAVLFTDDSRMALDMRDAGMLHPFSEDKAALCVDWPPDVLAGLLHASLPAWRLVGRRGPSAARPWLEREIEVLVARPKGGWAVASHERETAGADPAKTGVS